MSIDPGTLNRLKVTIWPALERAYGLPPGMLEAIAWWETRGTFRDQTSPKGARGIFQITPVALTQVRQEFGIGGDPSNPYAASVIAAALLSRYMRLFQNEATLAVAAYNAGEGTVRRYVRAVASAGRGMLPRETREYVQAVIPRVFGD